MESTNSLMEVTQLPVIKERLETLGKEIDERLKEVNQLAVTEETRKDVKKIRTEMRKEFDELESQRKQIKQMVLEPYMQFEEVYKINVADKYKEADCQLKDKIDLVENELLQELETEVKEYFNEACISRHIEAYIDWQSMNLKINLSSSFTSLKKQIDEKLDKIVNDIKMIDLEEFRNEIMDIYTQCYDFAKAKLAVINRKQQELKMEEARKKRLEEIEREKQIVENVEKVVDNEPIIIIPNSLSEEPVAIKEQEPQFKVSFRVTGTREQIVSLREYMHENNIEFESL